MARPDETPLHERWARFRFSVVGRLLAAPPQRGDLKVEFARLADTTWVHPVTLEPVRFGASTIERWFYLARNAASDPVRVLRRKVRKDAGRHPAVPEALRPIVVAQYKDHRGWSARLHYDNLAVVVQSAPERGPLPSYPTFVRFMKSLGLYRRKTVRVFTEGARQAEQRLDDREVRSYEAAYVHGLWHGDFHHLSLRVLLPDGEWVYPVLFACMDDYSRAIGHAQFYLEETAETFLHGVSQAFLKRGKIPGEFMTDNGSPMIAAETVQGFARLATIHATILPYSPYQNAKQESWWAQVEGRLIAMCERVPNLTLEFLNRALQAWVELEYLRKVHDELGCSPLDRLLAGPEVGIPCPDPAALRLAFTRQETRAQRRSDGSVSIDGRRYEIPSRYRALERVTVRFASWDLSTVHLFDPRAGVVLCRIYPQDKTRNAEGNRRRLEPLAGGIDVATEPAPTGGSGIAPLLEKLLEDYAATGLPPAYVPKTPSSEDPR
jgi:transposase InsO family protein